MCSEGARILGQTNAVQSIAVTVANQPDRSTTAERSPVEKIRYVAK